MKQIILLSIALVYFISVFVLNMFVEFSITTKIVIGIICLELLVIALVYVYDTLSPRVGIVYYKRMEYITNDTVHATYKIKIKRKIFGYPFIRVCRVSKEVYDSLTFGDTYNCTTGRITKP